MNRNLESAIKLIVDAKAIAIIMLTNTSIL